VTGSIGQDLGEQIPELMARVNVPGLSVALVEDGELTWSGAFGVKHRDPAEPVDNETVYQAASLSKPVFAFAVMQLVAQGVIALDTPLSTYLPQPYLLDDVLLDKVTARHVLSHMTGWPNWRPPGQPLQRDAKPGERFGYSGEGYVYLQRVVEHVTGRSLDELMQADVFSPMEMPRSSFAWALPEDPALATGHDHDGAPRPYRRGGQANAASSLHSTPSDFARFVATFVIHPNAIADEMLQPQVRVNAHVAWGLGWGLEASGAGQAFWHWGDNPGYKSVALALRDSRTGVVAMTNGDGGRPLCAWIVRQVLGADHPAFSWLDRRYPDLPRPQAGGQVVSPGACPPGDLSSEQALIERRR
jgi:CubicO group peptidase (beta-lactamase class C family)